MARNGSRYSWSFWMITVGAFLAILVFITLNDDPSFGTVEMQRELLTTISRSPSSPPPKNRTYQIVDPVDIRGIHKDSGGSVKTGFSPEEAGFSPEFRSFVQVGPDRQSLVLGNASFYITGFNNYYMHHYSVWRDDGRHQIDEVFASAKRFGFNVLRFWAFTDGDAWNSIQPELGIIDEAMLRDGLDYVVSEARKHQIRLILTLTNGQKEYGGMEQYVRWFGKDSISEFYSNREIKDAFKDYLYTIITRVNSIDQVMYRDNPTILGWDLANEPSDPGFPSSEAMQSWIEEMSSYVKELDPKHLLMIGWEGNFGLSTPDKTRFNRMRYGLIPLIDQVYTVDDVCLGSDFYENHLPEAIDISVAHLYPDNWIACDEECKLKFSRDWIRQHLEIAQKLNRPFLLGEFGKQKPIAYRNAFFKVVYSELLDGYKQGYPVAGSLVWMLANGKRPDYDGFTLYDNRASVVKPRPLFAKLNVEALVEDSRMRNRDQMVDCLVQRAEKSKTLDGKGRNRGWRGTIKLIANYSESTQEYMTELK